MTIKIPGINKKHSIPNNSDLFGTLHYTKNINLDEEGYIKLSSRMVSIFNQSTTSNIRLPLAFGRKSVFSTSTDFVDVQNGTSAFWLTLAETAITANIHVGTGVATLTEDSHGTWYKNLWHITDDNDIFWLDDVTDTATYTEITDGSPANLTSGVVHFLEVFRNKNALCCTNGNTVNLYTESSGTYTLDQTLTIPADFETVGLSYSNYQMGVIAMLSTSIGQNQDAYFFVWDGLGSEASRGVPIGSDKAIAVTAYKGSWVILTRTGILKLFTGGGWEDIATLPFYYRDLLWGQSFSRNLLGNVLLVDGDVIYINFNGILNAYGKNYEQVLNSNLGGVLCWDPKIGLYGRYTPSISPASMLTVTSGNINTTTDVLTASAGTIPSTGSQIKYTHDKSNQIGGLVTPRIYYVIRHNSTEFSLSTTKQNALDGVKVDITSTGAANNYFMGLETYDYGSGYANTSGALALLGKTLSVHDHIISGSELNDFDGTGNSNHINITVPGFESRGYIVTPKVTFDNALENTKKIYIKYRPLDTNDKIIVKFKGKDLIGLPVSTPQGRSSAVNQCSWTSSTVFTTTANLADAKTAFDAGVTLEVEVIAGSGAGTLVKLSNITFSSPTYTVTVEEAVDGAAASRFCDVIIDNWEKMGEITSTDTDGFKSFNIMKNHTWGKFKIELRGVETTIEDINIDNGVHRPSV
jgi:hypothetical protein